MSHAESLTVQQNLLRAKAIVSLAAAHDSHASALPDGELQLALEGAAALIGDSVERLSRA